MVSTRSVLIDQLEKVSGPVLAEHAAELVDIQFVHEHGQWVLRFFLDKPGGITLDDCANVSDHLSRILDAADIVPQAYCLEVSSPGLNRPLRKEQDFQRFAGERVDVTLYAPLDGRRHFRGTLRGLQEGRVLIEEEPDRQFAVPLDQVAKAKLDPEITI